MTDSKERPPGITITVPLSGPHRLAWATDAIDSIPLDEPRIAALHVVHSGGPWDWAPELRTRITRMPKVKVIEFPDRLELNESLTRVLSTVTTRWALLLPDDDAIVTGAMREGLRGAETALDGHAGLIAFGWQYLMDGRYRAGHVRTQRLAGLVRNTPKFCSTLINVGHLLALGGLQGRYGGYSDTVAFGQLVHRYGACLSTLPTGVYRMHDGQMSVDRHRALYVDAMDAAIDALCALTIVQKESADIAAALRQHALDPHSTAPHGLRRWLYRLRSRPTPLASHGHACELRPWHWRPHE